MNDKNAPRIACYLKIDNGELLLHPTAIDHNGLGVTIERPQHLDSNATDAEVGKAIRAMCQWCDYALYNEDIDTGGRGWLRFARQHHNVDVILADSISLIPSARDKKGVYWFLRDEREELPGDVSDETLGRAVRQVFSKCYEGERKTNR